MSISSPRASRPGLRVGLAVSAVVAAVVVGLLQLLPADRLDRVATTYAAAQLGTHDLGVVRQYEGGECHVVEVRTRADRVVHSVIFVSPDFAHPVFMSAAFGRSVFVPDSDDLCGLASSGIVTHDVTGRLTQHGPA